MKDELRSAVAEAMADKGESQAEMGGAGKSGKTHFSARLIFLPSFCCASQCVAVSRSYKITVRAGCPGLSLRLHPCAFLSALASAAADAFLPHSLWLKNQGQSKPVKVNQSDSVGQAGGLNRM
jgi:hypothetical protein